MNWIDKIPLGVWYGALSLCGLIAAGVIGLSALTLIKGGRIKAGKEGLELDTEEEKK